MKKIVQLFIAVLLVCTTVIPVFAIPESATVIKETIVNADEDNYELVYTVILPVDYKETEYYPVLLFLHGAGERGNDNQNHLNHVIDDLYATRPELLENTIIIAPQCPVEDQWVNTPWENGNYSVDEIPESKALKTALKLLDNVCTEYGGDRGQIYIMGVSMGGFGTWDAIMRHPEIFAAAVPICGAADPTKAEVLKDMPIRTFHGSNDNVVPSEGTRTMARAIRSAGNKDFYFKSYNGVGHNAWDYAAVDGEMIDWLYTHTLAERFPEVLETGPRETKAPETEAPETDAPETEAPETDAPTAPETKSNIAPYVIIIGVIAVIIVVITASKRKKK
ncbi:MAG: prolyl oligopeptidase family serine peptidase [Clostridia bacterium]|nr:prolyl oligopeptidase family serine peptidase [Clostridia bacterium]